MSARFDPAGPLRGALRPPPDKSISHRAAIVAAMGEGETTVENYLDSSDTRSTLEVLRTLGAEVHAEDSGPRIGGVGLRGPRPAEIDVGNAGTLLRILPGWLAGQGAGDWKLDGDESIRRRPVDRVAEPLSRMGAAVECRDGRFPPLRVGAAQLSGIEYRMPIASAQVKSCLLLAGLLAEGETSIVEPQPSRDHTERMLSAAGASVETEDMRPLAAVKTGPARRVTIRPVEAIQPFPFPIPGDFSSAAFFLAAALIVAGSEVRIEEVGLNPTRVGLLGILNRMGAAVEVEEGIALGGEPRGSIVARSGPLSATRVQAGEVPLAIDELPLVALIACFADGETSVSGAEELRHKESDRIATVVEGLSAVGAEIEATDDGFVVTGTGELRGGTIDAHGDHRLAMLGAIAGIASVDGVEVVDMKAAAVSYPGFEADLRSLLA